MSEHGECSCGTVYAHLAETGTSFLVVTAGTRLSTAVRRSPCWSGVDCFHKSSAYIEGKLNALPHAFLLACVLGGLWDRPRCLA